MNQESPASASNPQDSVRNALARVKIEKTSPPCSKLPPKKSPPGSSGKKLAPISRGERETDGPSTSTIIILEDLVNEIITLDDTQSSSTEFEAICGDKKETEEWLKQPRKKLGPYLPETKAIAPKSVPNKKGKDCPDCERVCRAISQWQFEFEVLTSYFLIWFDYSTSRLSEVPSVAKWTTKTYS